MRNVIYTCIIGDSDNVLEPNHITPGWDYVCFTNNKNLSSKYWTIKPFTKLYDNNRAAIHIKVNPDKYLPEYDLSVWVDGNISVNIDLDEFVESHLHTNSVLAISMHPDRNCVYEEIEAGRLMKTDSLSMLNFYNDKLKREKYPEQNGMVQSNIIIRKHNDIKLIEFSKRWWQNILSFSKRDQLSFNYVMYNFPISYNLFSADVLVKEFSCYKHSNISNANNKRKAVPVRKQYGENFYKKFNTTSKTVAFNKPTKKKNPFVGAVKKHNIAKSESNLKKVIYTCIIGMYDKLNDPMYVTSGWDYICYTNNPNITSKVWQVRFIENTHGDVKTARYAKTNPHHLLPEYDLSVWVDGSMSININLDEFIDTYITPGSILGVSMHPYRNCIYQELVACTKLQKENTEIIRKVNKKLRDEKFPYAQGLIQTGVLIRFHNNPDMIAFNRRWWGEIAARSHRDQLSFNYVMWKYPIPYNLFSGDIFEDKFLMYNHGKSAKDVNDYIKLRPDYGSNFYGKYGSNIKTKFIKKP